jgi:hypothetical protein
MGSCKLGQVLGLPQKLFDLILGLFTPSHLAMSQPSASFLHASLHH